RQFGHDCWTRGDLHPCGCEFVPAPRGLSLFVSSDCRSASTVYRRRCTLLLEALVNAAMACVPSEGCIVSLQERAIRDCPRPSYAPPRGKPHLGRESVGSRMDYPTSDIWHSCSRCKIERHINRLMHVPKMGDRIAQHRILQYSRQFSAKRMIVTPD